MTTWPPVIGIWGRSGSGKTALIEQLLQGFARRENLRVAVVKRCSHKMEVDRPGKDSDTIFRAGGDVFAHNPTQAFFRIHASETTLEECLSLLGKAYDLVLVEGHRTAPVPKIWLLCRDERDRSCEVEGVIEALPWDEKRLTRAEKLIMNHLQQAHAAVETCVAVLIGGGSSRMGRPKTMLKVGEHFLLERITAAARAVTNEVLLVGDSALPQPLHGMKKLPDVTGVDGPLAGILSALRWRPDARWIFLACDTPFVTPDALRWLLGQAQPGVWAVLPHLDDPEIREPVIALYEPPAAVLLERGASRGERSVQRILVDHKIQSPRIPAELRDAWSNINTPGDWDAARARLEANEPAQ